MNKLDTVIHDLAFKLCDLSMTNSNQKHALYVKTLQSLVRFAISEHLTAPIKEARDDMQRVDEIMHGK